MLYMILQPKQNDKAGYYFDTEGRPTGQPLEGHYEQHGSALQELLAAFSLRPNGKRGPCGFLHEKRIAAKYPESLLQVLYADDQSVGKDCLCSKETRRCTDDFAHVGDDLLPNPLGQELEGLAPFHLLDPVSWNAWHKETSEKIRSRDAHVAGRRWDPEIDEIVANAKNWQRNLRKDIDQKRKLLHAIIRKALDPTVQLTIEKPPHLLVEMVRHPRQFLASVVEELRHFMRAG